MKILTTILSSSFLTNKFFSTTAVAFSLPSKEDSTNMGSILFKNIKNHLYTGIYTQSFCKNN